MNQKYFVFFWEEEFFRQEQNITRVHNGNTSGVIISEDGCKVTNDHEVANAYDLESIFFDKKSYSSERICTDPLTDLAILKIAESKLPFIHFRNSDSVEVGEIVFDVGNQLNLESTVTTGKVSTKSQKH